ncbi:MAG TPA: hypothetical protein VNS49_09425 [Streptomyces sp.]|nr:hypothetical protein [Streptomyces sp.]
MITLTTGDETEGVVWGGGAASPQPGQQGLAVEVFASGIRLAKGGRPRR